MAYFGIHQQYHGEPGKTPGLTTVEKTLAAYPQTTHTREFTGGKTPLVPQNLIPHIERACRQTWNAGLTALWSVKPAREWVASGEWRMYFDHLCAYLVENKLVNRTILGIHHEPENDMSGPEFVSMFNTIHNWVKDAAPTLLTCHAALSYLYHPKVKGAIVPATYKTQADMNAIDIYSGRSWPLRQMLPEMEVFDRWYDAIIGDGAWSASERGFECSPEDELYAAETIDREAEWLATSAQGRECVLYMAWDTIGTEKSSTLPFGPGRTAAMQRLAQRITTPAEQPQPEPSKLNTRTIVCPLCNGHGDYTFSTEG